MLRKSFPGSPPIELKGREIESSLTPKAQPMPAPPPRPQKPPPAKMMMTPTSQPSDSTMRTPRPARDASRKRSRCSPTPKDRVKREPPWPRRSPPF